jgi:ribosomal protein S10
MTPLRAIGIPWYERETYRRILQIMEDATVLPATYEKWRYAADKFVRTAERSGAVVVRAIIDPDEFVGWCRYRD